jgi:hypothetical protein
LWLRNPVLPPRLASATPARLAAQRSATTRRSAHRGTNRLVIMFRVISGLVGRCLAVASRDDEFGTTRLAMRVLLGECLCAYLDDFLLRSRPRVYLCTIKIITWWLDNGHPYLEMKCDINSRSCLTSYSSCFPNIKNWLQRFAGTRLHIGSDGLELDCDWARSAW